MIYLNIARSSRFILPCDVCYGSTQKVIQGMLYNAAVTSEHEYPGSSPMDRQTLSRSTLLILLFVISGCTDSGYETALGTLERDRIAHTATVNEMITELPVSQGSFVKKGTVLVRLDDRLQRSKVDKAKADKARARAQLDKLQAGAREEEVAAARANVAGARAELIEAEKVYTRDKDLIGRGAVSQSQLDLALAKRDAAKANLKSAEERLRELENGSREEDLRIAQSELDAASAALAVEEKLLADLTVLASQDGVLDNLPWNLGERVTIGSPLAILLSGEAPYARVYLPEPRRVKIAEGDALMVRVDGIDTLFEGKVRWISSEPAFTPYYALTRDNRSRLVYLAEVQLPPSAAELPVGVPAQVLLP